jgi:hypothetical protein
MPMKLITKEIEAKMPKLYSGEKQNIAPVICKFFYPYGAGTWYVLEGEKQEDGDWLFFGLAEIHEKELGYFSLSELQSVKFLGRPAIERDLYFSGYVVDKTNNTVRKA